ncbi:TonB-dependent receptor [Thalassospira mesophila]|uniref:TonB-dependent receptor n=1 Tax=Thalassospira mesophila TaxID=1293891 RepID=UPI000A1E982E|nr:TonB-dependent siderophore receptor [Thalassospira mesophila]
MSLCAKCHRPFGFALLASASLLALTSGTALAQQSSAPKPEDQTIELDPITIDGQAQKDAGDPTPPVYAGGQVATGSRAGILGNQDVLDTPINTTAYTDQLIRDQQADTLADVVDNDPGVLTSYSYGGSGDRYMVRGFILDGDDVALDGLYGTAPRQLIDMSMYERVEITKGASAFINGMSPGGSGIGGMINLVPKRATDTPVTSFTTTYGMNSDVGGHIDIGRRFGKDNQFGIRANLKYSDGETAINDENRNSQIGALSFDYRGENTRITVDAGHNEKNVDHGRTSINVNSALTSIPDAPDADHNYNADGTWADLQDEFVQGRIEHDFNQYVMGYVAAGTRHTEEAGIYSTPTINGTDGSMTYSSSNIVRTDTTNSAITGARIKFETGPVHHDLNVGASAMRSKSHQAWAFATGFSTFSGNIYGDTPSSYPAIGTPTGNLNDPSLRNTNDMSSYFLADTASFLDDRLHLTGGVRRQSVTTRQYDLTSGARTKNYDADEYTPMVGVVGNVTNQISLYANYMESLSPGETAGSASSDPTLTNPSEQLAPYTSKQYEVGTKADFGNFGGSIALFQIEKPSAYKNASNTFTADGEQRNRGLEFQLFGEPVKGTRVLGGFTLLDAKLTDTEDGTNNGNNPIGVPDYVAKLGVEYDLPFMQGATVTARVIHTASQYVNVANTQEIPSWTRLDVGARYTTKMYDYPVTLRANIENLTNNNYWSSANGGYLTMGAPLTAKLALTADF